MTSEAAHTLPVLTFLAPALPRLTRTESQALSLIARHGAAMTLSLPPLDGEVLSLPTMTADGESGGASIWQLGFAQGQTDVLRAACTIRRDLAWAGAQFCVHLTNAAISAWINGSLAGIPTDALDEPMQAFAIETLLTQVCAAIDVNNVNGRPDVTAEGLVDHSLPHSWVVTIRHEATRQVAYAVLETDALGLMLIANLVQQVPSALNGLDDHKLPVTIGVDLGWTVLSAAGLRELQAQDTVFIDHYRVTPGGDLWLVAGAQGLCVRPQADSYCVTQSWTSLMNEIPKYPDAQDERDDDLDDERATDEFVQVFDADAVPVRLTFSLGERQLTLGELRRLQPGETFDLSRPLASGPVIIRANGAWVGTGDLVEIEGRVGVTLRALGVPEA
ncbi:type III secretion system cytoplasmic ring protein SctQ [Bordetella tumulicola]|uniref:type III secretion system cytoplasmic ring protein SctQ n=1 Tax=Bordetella tumulicola TaxID=1649133 RepID=UPI0039F04691